MKKRLVGSVRPFDINQNIKIYEGPNIILDMDIDLEHFSETIANLVQSENDIDNIDIIASPSFGQRYVDEIKNQITKYNLEREININYV